MNIISGCEKVVITQKTYSGFSLLKNIDIEILGAWEVHLTHAQNPVAFTSHRVKEHEIRHDVKPRAESLAFRVMPWIPASNFGSDRCIKQKDSGPKGPKSKKNKFYKIAGTVFQSQRPRRNKPHQDHEIATSASNLGATDARSKGLKGQKDQTPKRTNAPRLLVQVFELKDEALQASRSMTRHSKRVAQVEALLKRVAQDEAL